MSVAGHVTSAPSPFKEYILTSFVLLFLGHTWMYSNITVPNERSRVYLAVAIVDDHQLSIDGPLKRFGKIDDRSRVGPHYYSDKPPGAGFLATGVYAGVRLFTASSDWTIAELVNLMRTWIMLPFGLLGFVLVRRLIRLYSVDEIWVDLMSVGWILGSASFHYSSAFFSHQIVAVSLLCALYCLKRVACSEIGAPRVRLMTIAGACCGLATLTEYQAVVPCALLSLYACLKPRTIGVRMLVVFVLAALPFAGLLFWYNDAAFGHPLSLSYEHLAHATYRKIHGQGIAGVTWPTFESFKLWYLTPRRGLLVDSPMFLLAPVGIAVLVKSRMWVDALVLGAILTFYVLFLSSANIWGGDWGYGPRLAVPALGIFTVSAAIGAQVLSRWVTARLLMKISIVWGIVLTQCVHAFFPEPWAKAINPLADIVLPMARADYVAPNLIQKLSAVRGVTSLYPLGVLTLFISCFCIVRGERQLNSRSLVFMFVVCILVVGAGLYAMSQAPGGSPSSHAQWLKLIRLWHGRETSF